MTAILCVDAGGSNCRARLYSAEGALLAQAAAGPCNPSTDLPRAAASLREVWLACAPAGLAAESVTLSIGGAGMFVTSVRDAFLAAIPPFAHAHVMSDGYAALIGAAGGRPAALIIAGTGIVGHRLYADGTSIQRDGWGWIGGDRGSGAWIGRRALRHALAVLDGLAPADPLSNSVIDALDARDRRKGGWLIGMGPEKLAALVPLVLGADCATAAAIIDGAAAQLAGLATTLDLDADTTLFLAGGLAGVLRERIGERLGRDVATPAADAFTGCLLVARGDAPEERMIERRGQA